MALGVMYETFPCTAHSWVANTDGRAGSSIASRTPPPQQAQTPALPSHATPPPPFYLRAPATSSPPTPTPYPPTPRCTTAKATHTPGAQPSHRCWLRERQALPPRRGGRRRRRGSPAGPPCGPAPGVQEFLQLGIDPRVVRGRGPAAPPHPRAFLPGLYEKRASGHAQREAGEPGKGHHHHHHHNQCHQARLGRDRGAARPDARPRAALPLRPRTASQRHRSSAAHTRRREVRACSASYWLSWLLPSLA